MQVITFSAIKGGVGKTTLTYNFAEWLSSKGYKVLVVDSDHQRSLSETYQIYTDEGCLDNVFLENNLPVKVHHIHENLDLISCSPSLDDVNNQIQTNSTKLYFMYMWMQDNFREGLKLNQYDYTIIDTHPDFSTITKNMVLSSDYILSPLEPSEYGFASKIKMEERLKGLKEEAVDPMSRKSFVRAELLFIGNRVKHNTKSSKDFIDILSKDDTTVELIPEKELFNKGTLNHTPIVEMEKDKNILKTKSNKEFFKKIEIIFTNIKNRIDE